MFPEFSQSEYSVREDEGQLEVCVGISRANEIPVRIQLATQSGTAQGCFQFNTVITILILWSFSFFPTAPNDFTSIDEILTFTPASSPRSECRTSNISNDNVFEGEEMFFVTLISNDPRIHGGSSATCFIIGDEGTYS